MAELGTCVTGCELEQPLQEREKLHMLVTLLTSRDLSTNIGTEELKGAFRYVLDKTMGGTAQQSNDRLCYLGDLFGEYRVYRATMESEGMAELSTAELGSLSNFIEFAKKRENPPSAENSP